MWDGNSPHRWLISPTCSEETLLRTALDTQGSRIFWSNQLKQSLLQDPGEGLALPSLILSGGSLLHLQVTMSTWLKTLKDLVNIPGGLCLCSPLPGALFFSTVPESPRMVNCFSLTSGLHWAPPGITSPPSGLDILSRRRSGTVPVSARFASHFPVIFSAWCPVS